MKRQRTGDGGPRILKDCTGSDDDAPKEDFIPKTGLWQRPEVTTEEHKTEGKTFNVLAPAGSKEKADSLAKELEEPATFSEPCTMVGSVESISSENQVEPYERVPVATPTEKQGDKLIKQRKHAAPSSSMTSENIVTSNGLFFTLQFESQVVSMQQKPTLPRPQKVSPAHAVSPDHGGCLKHPELAPGEQGSRIHLPNE